MLENNEQFRNLVQQELALCEEKDKDAKTVVQECLIELEEKGFVNISGETVQQ